MIQMMRKKGMKRMVRSVIIASRARPLWVGEGLALAEEGEGEGEGRGAYQASMPSQLSIHPEDGEACAAEGAVEGELEGPA